MLEDLLETIAPPKPHPRPKARPDFGHFDLPTGFQRFKQQFMGFQQIFNKGKYCRYTFKDNALGGLRPGP